MQQDFKQQFLDLWQRRDVLTESERNQLWSLIHALLERCPYLQRHEPAWQREDIIQSFVKKLLETHLRGKDNTAAWEFDNPWRLCSWLKNYIISDFWRRQRRENEDAKAYVGSIATTTSNPTLDDLIDILTEYNLDADTVGQSARHFMDSLDEGALAYMVLSECPDNENKVPRYILAKRYQIPSYHRRAAQLGITARGALDVGATSGKDYHQTDIGQWMVSLGVDPPLEHDLALALLKILCHEALSRVRKGADGKLEMN